MSNDNLNIVTMSYGSSKQKTIRYMDKNKNNRILKEVVYYDKNNDGEFKQDEITQITVWGYSKSGKTACTKTFTDTDSDGYQDTIITNSGYIERVPGRYYKIEQCKVADLDANDLKKQAMAGDEYAIETLNKLRMTYIDDNYINNYKALSETRDFYEELYGTSFEHGIM